MFSLYIYQLWLKTECIYPRLYNSIKNTELVHMVKLLYICSVDGRERLSTKTQRLHGVDWF